MVRTVKDGYIIDYYSKWVIAHEDNWSIQYDAIVNGDYLFDNVIDGEDIKNQFVYFLRWLIESKKLIDKISVNEIPCCQILFMVKEKKQLLLSDLPDVLPKDQSWNVDEIRNTVYALYNHFFEFVRQLDLLTAMSEEAVVCLQKQCHALSTKIKEYHKSYEGNKIRQVIRDVNSKLDWSERIVIEGLRNFVNQIQGWLEDRLFDFVDSIIPYQYLSIEELIKDLDFQYNYLESKSKTLSSSYSKDVEPLVSIANEIWERFKIFYSEISQLNSQFAPTKVLEDFPIRTLFLLGRIPEMIESIRSVFASVPPIIFKSPGMQESHFHIAMHTMFKALRLKPFSEQAINGGRLDMLIPNVETVYEEDETGAVQKVNKDVLFILEFKKSDTSKDESKEALNQIQREDYGFPYKDDYYKVYGIGLCFSTEERNIFKNNCDPTLLYEDGNRMFVISE